MFNHPSPYRVELYITHAAEQIAVAIHHACLESSSPQMPSPLEAGIDPLNIHPIEVLHQPAECTGDGGCQQQVNMIGHQAPAMHAHLQLARIRIKQMQVFQIAPVIEEYGLAVDTALHYMVWQPDDLQSRLAWHHTTLPG